MIDLAVVFIFVDAGKEIAVDNADAVTFLHELQRLIDVLHLIVVRMRLAVRRNQSVDAERAVIRFVAKVASVKSPLQPPPTGGGFLCVRIPPPVGGGKGEA